MHKNKGQKILKFDGEFSGFGLWLSFTCGYEGSEGGLPTSVAIETASSPTVSVCVCVCVECVNFVKSPKREDSGIGISFSWGFSSLCYARTKRAKPTKIDIKIST